MRLLSRMRRFVLLVKGTEGGDSTPFRSFGVFLPPRRSCGFKTVRCPDYHRGGVDPSYGEMAGWPLPVLLRGARAAFGSLIRRELDAAGFDDVPPNGLFVLGAVGHGSTPLADVIAALGVSKQTAGALVDTLVVRGYLERRADAVDRRRLTVCLTDRGKGAADVIRAAVSAADADLAAAVGAETVSTARRALAALIELGRQDD